MLARIFLGDHTISLPFIFENIKNKEVVFYLMSPPFIKKIMGGRGGCEEERGFRWSVSNIWDTASFLHKNVTTSKYPNAEKLGIVCVMIKVNVMCSLHIIYWILLMVIIWWLGSGTLFNAAGCKEKPVWASWRRTLRELAFYYRSKILAAAFRL